MRALQLTICATLAYAGVTSGQATHAHPVVQSKAVRAAAVATYRMRNSKDAVIYLLGTTPVRNWKMTAHGLRGEARMAVSDDNQLSSIEALSFSLPVYNLKGDESGMDEDAYKALKADQYKDITFTLRSAAVEVTGDRQYVVRALGSLSVAGVTRTVTLTMRSRIAADGTISFTGSQLLRMSDYNVERPSLLFGVIKAGDEMTLNYTLIFTK